MNLVIFCVLFVNKIITSDKSTPVRAWMAGGTWATNLLISLEKLDEPLSITISSVLARGAATSAAIYTKKKKKFVQPKRKKERKEKKGIRLRNNDHGPIWYDVED